jgi:serine-type D-Ala-D-Ala carboxypeptidase/endopeptidase
MHLIKYFLHNKCFALIAVLCFPVIAFGSSFPSHKLDSIAGAFLSKSGSSCIVICIINHGKREIFTYGTLEKNGRIAADSNTIFEIGSITKLFTSLEVARLVATGKMHYSDSISMYLPRGTRAPGFQGHPITMQKLLNHTSGLPRIPDNLMSPEKSGFDSLNPYAAYSLKNLYEYLNNCKLERSPGDKYEYSNLGMGLAGDIISSYYSEPYGRVISREILFPLHMIHTTALSDTSNMILAKPYSASGREVKNWDFEAMAGAGAIRSDAADMGKFLKFTMNPGGNSDSLLSRAMQDCQRIQINAAPNLKVGLGWHISPLDGDSLFWHNGRTGGYRSFLGFTKDKQNGVVILTNSESGVDNMSIQVLHWMDMEN